MSLDSKYEEFNKLLQEIQQELDEANMSGAVAGYQSPNIFMAKPPRTKDIKKQNDILTQMPSRKAKKSYKNTVKASDTEKK
jgi:uncharacterized protein YukE